MIIQTRPGASDATFLLVEHTWSVVDVDDTGVNKFAGRPCPVGNVLTFEISPGPRRRDEGGTGAWIQYRSPRRVGTDCV